MTPFNCKSVCLIAATIFIMVAVVVNGLPATVDEAPGLMGCCEPCLESGKGCSAFITSEAVFDKCGCIVEVGSFNLRERRDDWGGGNGTFGK